MDLGKQVGPLPLGGWFVVVAAALTLGWFANRNKPKGPPTEDQLLADTGVGTGAAAGEFVYSPPATITNPSLDSDETWYAEAMRWGVGNGISPTRLSVSLAKYLQGAELASGERGDIDKVLKAIGPSPYGGHITQLPPLPARKITTPIYLATKRGESVSNYIARAQQYYQSRGTLSGKSPLLTRADLDKLNANISKFLKGGKFTSSQRLRVGSQINYAGANNTPREIYL